MNLQSRKVKHTSLDYINHNVWFQKISIPPPRKVTGISEGEGGSKREISEGRGGSR